MFAKMEGYGMDWNVILRCVCACWCSRMCFSLKGNFFHQFTYAFFEHSIVYYILCTMTGISLYFSNTSKAYIFQYWEFVSTSRIIHEQVKKILITRLLTFFTSWQTSRTLVSYPVVTQPSSMSFGSNRCRFTRLKLFTSALFY